MKQEIIGWIKNIQQIDGIPPKEVIAFNFGIFQDETGYKIYLVGGFEYDENDDDWASIEPPKELHRYLNLSSKLQKETWEFILDYFADMLMELENEGELNIPLFENAIAITVGFDDGDLIKIR